ncbi:hypothetical protein ACJX0J_026989, partial [Zea mays]
QKKEIKIIKHMKKNMAQHHINSNFQGHNFFSLFKPAAWGLAKGLTSWEHEQVHGEREEDV